MDLGTKSKTRRQEIRKNRPDAVRLDWNRLKEQNLPQALGVAFGFFVLATAILLLREMVVHVRPGQPVTHDIVSRVDFVYFDQAKLDRARLDAAQAAPRSYAADPKVWDDLRDDLLSLPGRAAQADKVAQADPKALPPELAAFSGDLAALRVLVEATEGPRAATYRESVKAFVRGLRDNRQPGASRPLVVLPADERARDLKERRKLVRLGSDDGVDLVDLEQTFAAGSAELAAVVREKAAGSFELDLQQRMADHVAARLRPTHPFDAAATTKRQNDAQSAVPVGAGDRRVARNEILVLKAKRYLDSGDLQLLRAENQAYLATVTGAWWKSKAGVATTALLLTAVLSLYVAVFQPRAVRNTARAGAIAGLLLSMLLLAGLSGIGNGPIYLFGTAPTMLVAMILAIAYDRRFAIGIASLHGLLVTVALDQTAPFFLVLWVGVLAAGFMLDDVRTRSKLVEVGGASAIAMMVATAAAGLIALESGQFVLTNCLWAGLGGLLSGAIALTILPFIERLFRITTSMTLLELADPSHPLLRRLQQEAPGTYNHSLQVATLAESAAEAIGGNSLLCRVASYYHDVGKINKPDYFVENQQGGANRHMNLDPNLSLLIIIGHVKDGVELAREYNLPSSFVPFIQQHHGTTVVEYFYRRACTQQEQRDPTMPAVSETQFRYPGPRPRTREVAIVMIADAVESATRALDDPSPAQIEGLVRDLTMKRLLDGQFDECDLTMKDIDRVRRSLVKSLAGIYHGRIPYPSAPLPAAAQQAGPQPASAGPATIMGTVPAIGDSRISERTA
ncbi:MAG TPA: HDIG domain-containing protein [Humisphaera sp.]